MPRCFKCNKTISKNEEFCKHCGTKLKHKIEKSKKHFIKNYKKIWIPALIVILLILIFFVFFQFREEESKSFIEGITKKAECGNNKCERGEDSSNCCLDCSCPAGYTCDNNACKKLAECGNGIAEEGETSNNCCLDVGCSVGYRCKENRCIELKPKLNVNFEQGLNIKSVTYFKAKEREVGSLTVSNSGNSKAKNVNVKISSPENYFNDEVIQLGEISEDKSRTKSFSLIFTEKALDITSKIELKLSISLTFEDEDNREHMDFKTATFLVEGRNYLVWYEPEEIASWITTNHPTIKEFASKSTAGLAASSRVGSLWSQELAARWLLESMRAYGIRYVNDPFNRAGDYIQFPTETLINKAGDCEDNAVLYASLLGAVGIEPVIFLTPRHAFAGYKNIEGKLVPIETTSLDFDTALASGKFNIEKNKDNLEIIELDWQSNPQVILPVNKDLKLPSITKNIGECKTSFNFKNLFVASVKITFTTSGEVKGAGCASVITYQDGKKKDEVQECWTLNPKETKEVTFQPDISIFGGYTCVAI